jgi:hypothetical protein
MSSGPNIIRDGLVFHYDLSDGKSFAGEPTTNYIYHQNPRIDGTYTSYMPESGQGTIAVNHPQAIRVYNTDGNDISYYLNGGVTDWTNARHAYWIYDNDLKKPVVQSYDVTGSWQAKYLDTGMGAWSSLGMSAGSKYTISWLQWTNNLTKRAHVGFYSRDNGGGFNFWDGLSSAPVNTKTHTWERLSQTFTVSASRNLNDTFGNVYFYTHVFDYGIIRIADVQLELKDHPTKFSPTLTRSTTNSLIDRTKNLTSIDVSNVSFNSQGKMIFDGTNDYIFSPSAAPSFTNNVTFSCWFKTSVQQTNKYIMAMGKNLTGNNGMDLCLQGTDVASYIVGSSSFIYLNYNTNYQNNQWHMLTVTYNGTSAVLYYDGVAVNSGSFTQNVDIEATRRLAIGSWVNGGANFNGEIDVMQIYNRGLSASEVSQNYNSLRKKFGV